MLRLRSTVCHMRAQVSQSPYKTLGYMRMNFSCQFSHTIINHETVCKAVLILQQQRQGHTFQFFVYHVQGQRYGQFCARQYVQKQLRGYLVGFR